MTDDEIKTLLFDIITSCYQSENVIYHNIIFYIYDEKFIRKVKVNKLNNNKIKMKLPNKVNGECIFYVINNIPAYIHINYDYIFKYLFNNRYNNIIDNYGIIENYKEKISEIISNIMNEYDTSTTYDTNNTSWFTYSNYITINLYNIIQESKTITVNNWSHKLVKIFTK